METWIPGSRTVFLWGDFFDCRPDWSWSVQKLPNLDLWYLTDGAGWIEGEEEGRMPIRAGDCLLLRPGGSYESWNDSEQSFTLIAVHFELVDENGHRLDPPSDALPPFIRQMHAHGLFREVLTRAIEFYRDGRGQWASAWLQAALMEVLRQDTRTWPAGPLGEQARKIEQICNRIRSHPERRVRVDDLAAELYISPEHFCRLFRRFQGEPPRAYITRTRIEAAQTLLLTSNYSITRVSEILGYDTPFHFSRQFKAKVGISPSAFRKRATGRNTPEN